MRYGLFIFTLTLAALYNKYYDGYLINLFKNNKKYIEMSIIAFAGLSIYLFMRKFPTESSSLLKHGSTFIKYVPIDKDSKRFFTPIFDLTSKSKGQSTYNHFSNNQNTFESVNNTNQLLTPNQNQNNVIHQNKATKRSVSETRKKYVASQQNWRCNHCNQQLDATFEVDHVHELQDGGTNDVSNLVALCRNCHGKKTLFNRLQK